MNSVIKEKKKRNCPTAEKERNEEEKVLIGEKATCERVCVCTQARARGYHVLLNAIRLDTTVVRPRIPVTRFPLRINRERFSRQFAETSDSKSKREDTMINSRKVLLLASS